MVMKVAAPIATPRSAASSVQTQSLRDSAAREDQAQRRCSTDLARSRGGVPPQSWRFGAIPLLPKLAVAAPRDRLEDEADQIAARVMRMPEPTPARDLSSTRADAPQASETLDRKCAACQESDELQRTAESSAISGAPAPPIVHDVLQSPGQPLETRVRSFMEPRFGHDFGRVRVHADARAAASARAVNALAYTVGSHIAFAADRYAPDSREGRQLLAHELAHVTQQSGRTPAAPGTDAVIRRKTDSCARPSGVPATFCVEFPSTAEAEADRSQNKATLIASAKAPVIDGGSGEVESLYTDFIDGGQAHRDLSGRLAKYFTKSSATVKSTKYLLQALDDYFKANPPPPGGSVTKKLEEAIQKPITALGTPGDSNAMAFRDYTETPGVLAGGVGGVLPSGVGATQNGCLVGKIPSHLEDQRSATGTATATRNSDDSINVNPDITFKVIDTLDFCPGNPGSSSSAQAVTVPLSRYEASDISGDVPFTVEFPAPALVGAYDADE